MGAKLFRAILAASILAPLAHTACYPRWMYGWSGRGQVIPYPSGFDGSPFPYSNGPPWLGLAGVTVFRPPEDDRLAMSFPAPVVARPNDYGWPCKWMILYTIRDYKRHSVDGYHVTVLKPAVPVSYVIVMMYIIGWATTGRMKFSIRGFHHSHCVAIGALAAMAFCVVSEYVDVFGKEFSLHGLRWQERLYADTAVAVVILLGVTAAGCWFLPGPSRTASAPG